MGSVPIFSELWIFRESSSGVCFYHKSIGLGWSSGGKLDTENYGFEVGASKLFNNLTTSPKKIGKCPYFTEVP